jgi:Fe-S-cluster containining protein
METDLIEGGLVPNELTEPLNSSRVYMSGTNTTQKRCVALKGEIGSCVSCSIYDNRPSPCREFKIHGENGIKNEDCNRARAFYGLPPIYPTNPQSDQPENPIAA